MMSSSSAQEWTQTEEGHDYIAEVSKSAVARIAPEELEIFDELIEEYFADPEHAKESAPQGDHKLGFGVGGLLVAVTPVAAAIASAVITYVVNEVVKSLKDEGSRSIRKTIRDIFSREDDTQALSPQQMNHINEVALNAAQEFGYDPAQARLLVSAIIGALALAHSN